MMENSSKKSCSRKAIISNFQKVLLACAVMCSINITSAEAKVINLTYSTAYMPFEPPSVQANRVMDFVEKKTNGNVKTKRFMGGSLGGVNEQIGLVSSGAVDMISLHIDQYPQKFPLHKILNSDQNISREEAFSNIRAIMNEIPETSAIFEEEQKRNNIKMLYPACMGGGGIMSRIPVRSLSELKGKKISVITSYQRNVYKELGWIPVNVNLPEVYEALSRGVVDAASLNTAVIIPLKFYEVGKTYIVMGTSVVYSLPFTFNRDTWNNLPEDVQKAFCEASMDTVEWTIEENKQTVEKTYESLKNRGVSIVTNTQKEDDIIFDTISRHATKDWIENATAAGVADKATIIDKYWNEMKYGRWIR